MLDTTRLSLHKSGDGRSFARFALFAVFIVWMVSSKMHRYPKTNVSMQDLPLLLGMLENNVSFGFAHFNDGEVMTLKDCVHQSQFTDRDWQSYSRELTAAMVLIHIYIFLNYIFAVTSLIMYRATP